MWKSLRSGVAAGLLASALVMGMTSVVMAAVDVNKATAAELDSIKGIGPSISKRILEERAKGPFKDWQDFIHRVNGVGANNAAKFSKEGLTLNGQSMSADPKSAKEPPASGSANKGGPSPTKTPSPSQ